MKICVLGLLIEWLVEIRCDNHWSRIKENLEELQVSCFLPLNSASSEGVSSPNVFVVY
jgi:hypothetical protein